MLVCQNFYNQRHFFSQILHTHVLNKDTHVDHNNIFINYRVSNFAIKIFNLMHIVNFSRKLLGKRVRKHIIIKSVTLNVQSVRQP